MEPFPLGVLGIAVFTSVFLTFGQLALLLALALAFPLAAGFAGAEPSELASFSSAFAVFLALVLADKASAISSRCLLASAGFLAAGKFKSNSLLFSFILVSAAGSRCGLGFWEVLPLLACDSVVFWELSSLSLSLIESLDVADAPGRASSKAF